jgi:hemoglobin
MKTISTLDDIKLLVDEFYGKVREDELIGPIFNEVIKDNWTAHLEKMYSFWQTVLLQEMTYKGAPFPKHMKLPVEQEHFDRWLQLFYETIDSYFFGEKADELKMRSRKMAEMFMMKINFFRENPKNYIQ